MLLKSRKMCSYRIIIVFLMDTINNFVPKRHSKLLLVNSGKYSSGDSKIAMSEYIANPLMIISIQVYDDTAVTCYYLKLSNNRGVSSYYSTSLAACSQSEIAE